MGNSNVIEKPTDQLLYRYHARINEFVGVGKQEWYGYEPNKNTFIAIHSKIILALSPFTVVLVAIFGYVYLDVLKEYDIVILFAINFVLMVTLVIKILNALSDTSKDCIKSFMTEIHLYFVHHRNEYSKKKTLQTERWSRLTFYFSAFTIGLCTTLWVIIPTCQNVRNRERIANRTMITETSGYIYVPFDILYDLRNWLIYEYCVIFYGQWIYCYIIYALDTMAIITMLHFVGHLHILKHEVESQSWNSMSDSETKESLVDIAKYHGFIKRNFNKLQAAYSMIVVMNHFYNLVVDSMLIYELMFGDRTHVILHMLMASYFMAGLIVWSTISEEIRSASEDCYTAIYVDIPWTSMSLSNQKMVLLLLIQTQDPMDFKTYGYSIGYQPMIGIFKTTFSYYVMLKETNGHA